MISTLIALPYEVARLPLVIADNRLSDRLTESSPVVLALERAIGSVDKVAGALLRNREIAERGADRVERSDKLARAARLEKQASATRRQARDTAATGRHEAAEQRREAQDRAESGLEEADAAEARGKHEAEAKAEKVAAAKKASADERAERRVEVVDRRKKSAAASAKAKKKAAADKAEAGLEEAREARRSAAEQREDADRLDDLTEARKQERKED